MNIIKRIKSWFSPKTVYTVDYFIDKFSKIPEEEIGTGSTNNHCALWHVGVKEMKMELINDEALALENLFSGKNHSKDEFEWGSVYHVNDASGECRGWEITHPTAKQRILRKLYEIKNSNK